MDIVRDVFGIGYVSLGHARGSFDQLVDGWIGLKYGVRNSVDTGCGSAYDEQRRTAPAVSRHFRRAQYTHTRSRPGRPPKKTLLKTTLMCRSS